MGMGVNIVPVTGAHTAHWGEMVLADATGGAFTVTLPPPSGGLDPVIVKNTGATNNVTVARSGSALIDGATSILLPPGQALTVVPDGNNWQITAKTITKPAAPTIGVAVAGVEEADVSFTPPAVNGGAIIIDYTATSTPDGITGTGTASPVTVSGLTGGTDYTFTVHARNVEGSGPESAASNSVTPTTMPVAPPAPTIGTAVAGDASATVPHTVTGTGGSPITGAVITPYIAGVAQTPQTFMDTATSHVVTGLTNGTTYTFKVALINAIGTGAQSSASNAVTPAAPFTPAALGSKLKVWLEGDMLSLSDADPVAAWNSASPATVNASQSSSSAKPTYRTSQINGLPIVRFVTDDYMTLGTATIISETAGSEFTVFYVAKIPSNGGTQWVLARDDNALGRDFAIGKDFGTANGVLAVAGIDAINIPGAQPDTYQLVTVDSQAGTYHEVYLNGVSKNSNNYSSLGGTATGETDIGRRSYSGAENYATMDLAAIIVCTPRCTSTEIANVHAYLLAKCGL